MVVHQLVPRFAEGDPVAQAAVELQVAFRRIGAWGEIFAAKAARKLSSLARPAKDLQPAPSDWVVYHHIPGSALDERVASLPCRRVVVFHAGGATDALRAFPALHLPATEETLRQTFAAPFSPSEASPERSRRIEGPGRRPRVALIVQRYGEAIGGAESHARSIAHRLSPHWDITVLTTCAKDHLTWRNAWPAGESRDGPVRILRFRSERTRTMFRFNALSRGVFGRANDRLREEHWVAEQGPLVPGLLRHLAQEKSYDGYLFFTYLYAPTAWGLPLVGDRALVIPTAHDEPALALHAFADVFERARAILCNTPEEENLIHSRFPTSARARVVGVGIDAPAGNAARFRERFGVERPYLLYVGRIEKGKDIPELLRFHAALGKDGPDLLLAGARHMRVGGKRVRHLGQVSDADKFDAIAGAEAVVVPSRFESLSLLSLEAFSQGAPVVANGRSPVLAGQCERSGAGITYVDALSFRSAVKRARADRRLLGERGIAYAREHSWANVIQTYLEEMGRILGRRGGAPADL